MARWRVLVIHELLGLGDDMRFGELNKASTGISHSTLTKQLRGLEAAGLLTRKVYTQVPPKVEDSLTPLRESLEPVLLAMEEWGEAYDRARSKEKRRTRK